jgi:hypothetical protein
MLPQIGGISCRSARPNLDDQRAGHRLLRARNFAAQWESDAGTFISQTFVGNLSRHVSSCPSTWVAVPAARPTLRLPFGCSICASFQLAAKQLEQTGAGRLAFSPFAAKLV